MKIRTIRNSIHTSRQRGYTLIELLLVVSIISLISSILLVTFVGARREARDLKRVADIRNVFTILTDLEIKNGRYPCHSLQNSLQSDFMSFLTSEGYFAQPLKDPLNSGAFTYLYATFRSPGTNQCGKSVMMEIYMETVGQCPTDSTTYTVEHDHGPGMHCHIFFPVIPAAPCNTPQYLDNPHTCPWIDTINDY